MRKILFRIFVILTSLFIIVSIFTMFHISFLGFRIYRIGSGSMSPYLKVNDYILIKESKEYEKKALKRAEFFQPEKIKKDWERILK